MSTCCELRYLSQDRINKVIFFIQLTSSNLINQKATQIQRKPLTLIIFSGKETKNPLTASLLSWCLFNSRFHEPLSPFSPIIVKQLFGLWDKRPGLITDTSLIKRKLWLDGTNDMTARTLHPYPLLLAE